MKVITGIDKSYDDGIRRFTCLGRVDLLVATANQAAFFLDTAFLLKPYCNGANRQKSQKSIKGNLSFYAHIEQGTQRKAIQIFSAAKGGGMPCQNHNLQLNVEDFASHSAPLQLSTQHDRIRRVITKT